MLTVVGGLAEFERELTGAKTGDGRKRAKKTRCALWSGERFAVGD
jgi:DNA invertase Pin-like site-specific DNA recombinase